MDILVSLSCSTSLAVFYGASAFNADISKWNTGAVTNMGGSKFNLYPSLFVTSPCCVFFDMTTSVSLNQFSHVSVLWFLVLLLSSWIIVSLSFLLHPLWQCFITQLCSIQIFQNGVRVLWQGCITVSVISLRFLFHASVLCFYFERQLEFHLVNSHTFFSFVFGLVLLLSLWVVLSFFLVAPSCSVH